MGEESANAAPKSTSQQMLTFVLAGEVYGVDILKVREIRGWSSVTHIPQAPKDVLGVLNLRGAIVPIIDLRARFGLEASERTPVTVIIVLSVESAGRPCDVGLLVDSVSDVADVGTADMQDAPELSSRTEGGFLRGLASIGDRMILVLNTDHLVTEIAAMAA